MPEKVLVACPTHQVKEYAFETWALATEQLTYPSFDVMVVDNSPSLDFWERIRKRLPKATVIWDGKSAQDQLHPLLRISQSMEIIRQHLLAGPYIYWFNMEADVIPPSNVIERLLELAPGADWISHSFPVRGGNTDDQQGIGCSLLSRNMMQNFDYSQCGDNGPDNWLWNQVKPTKRYKAAEFWGYFPVEHLKEPE